MSSFDYVALVDWTGRQLHPAKRGHISGPPPAALRRTIVDPDRWMRTVAGVEVDYWRAVGAVDALLAKAKAMGQCWLKGIGVARQRRKRAATDGVTQSGTTTRHSSAAL